MRVLFTGLILCTVLRLAAQQENEPYYLQQAPVQMALDCYQRNLDEGLAAQKRGDCRLALRWFNEARHCPEALKIPARQEELNALIAQCSQQKKATLPAANQRTRSAQADASSDAGRSTRRFQPSREFLLYDHPNCFTITVREADRAYAGGYWSDAEALYRAAKNCADADQADRMAANQHIEACKTASRDELRRKEQEAVEQARHALAAHRANTARQLLREYDRSLAYRLADFANEYIAPDDNDACRQAMFDALYYNPTVHSDLTDDHMRIPFCYQLGDNLDHELQVRFLGKGTARKVCAFARSRHLLFQWDAASFEPLEPVALEDTTLNQMDAVPDGRTLLFTAKNAFLFWRSPRESFRLPVRAGVQYCFDAEGQNFYFLDPADMGLYALSLREVFASRKGFSQRATPKPLGQFGGYNLLAMACDEEGNFWLGFRDSLVLLERKSLEHRRTLHFAEPLPTYSNGALPTLWLQPSARSLTLGTDTAAFFFRLPDNDTAFLRPDLTLPGYALTASRDAQLVATYQLRSESKPSRLLLYNPTTGLLDYGALLSSENADKLLLNGIVSPDNKLFASTTADGKLDVWVLSDGPGQNRTECLSDAFVELNADGSTWYTWQNTMLEQHATTPPYTEEAWAITDGGGRAFLIAGQQWVALRQGFDSLVLTDKIGRQRWAVSSPASIISEIVAAFNPEETLFAYLAAPDSVVVMALSDGHTVAAHGFGSDVMKLYFVPGTGEIMVVQWVKTEDGANEQVVVKLWSAESGPETPLRTVRLHGYATSDVAFSPAQEGYIAFTNGQDIRVFQQYDLLDEAIHIRSYGARALTAMAFNPEGNTLAAGYDDGTIVCWDMASGQARFSWERPVGISSREAASVTRLRWADNGRRLHFLLAGNTLFTRDVDLALVRTGVQTDYRKLTAFTPEHIREYDLEQALGYPGNFTRLAASGDLPLIRSFFDYYREAALNSNNIERVGAYCERASILYRQLDESAQNVLQRILLEMFEDYHWKLLQRNQIERAQQLTKAMQEDFGNPLPATLAAAHTALLRNDLRAATRLYADWALRISDREAGDGVISQTALDSLHHKVRQLIEYDILQPKQVECLCGLFGAFPVFEPVCTPYASSTSETLLDGQTRLRWRILQRLFRSTTVISLDQKTGLLEKALEDARQLLRQYPGNQRRDLEKATLFLAGAYEERALFEQGNTLAVRYHEKAIQQLGALGTFQTAQLENTRLEGLARCYLNLGSAHLNANRLETALNTLQQGLQTTERLLQRMGADSSQYQYFSDNILSDLYLQTGYTQLLLGQAAAARAAFEQANNARREGIHSLFFGHAAILAGDQADALIQYGGIYDDESLGRACFDLERMAEQLPAQRARLRTFAAQMRSARLATKSQLDADATDFFRANQHVQHQMALEQWDSALWWNTIALRDAEQVLNRSRATETWQENWLNAVLSQTYLLLFQKNPDTARLSQTIRYSFQAERYLDHNDDFYYADRYLLKTNLAHAYWLRGQTGDRDKALTAYQAFLQNPYKDTWGLLLKDFRDLRRAGVPWPDLAGLIRQIRPPDARMTAEDWQALGLPAPED